MVLTPALRRTAIAAALLALAGCGGSGSGRTADGRPIVLTTTWALADVTQRLVAGAAEVDCVVPPGQDVRTWSPSREELRALGEAALVVRNGAGLESWIGRSNLPRARVVDTTAGFADRLIETESEVAHSHGDGEAHTHTGTDPHTWLDPELLGLQARAIAEALDRVLPEQAPMVDAHLEALLTELAALAARLRSLPPLADGAVLVATHPTWAYLARPAGLAMVEADVDPAASDADAVVARLEEVLAGRKAVAVLWEREPGQAIRDAVSGALGARSVVIDPQVVRPESGGEPATLAALERGIAALRTALTND